MVTTISNFPQFRRDSVTAKAICPGRPLPPSSPHRHDTLLPLRLAVVLEARRFDRRNVYAKTHLHPTIYTLLLHCSAEVFNVVSSLLFLWEMAP